MTLAGAIAAFISPLKDLDPSQLTTGFGVPAALGGGTHDGQDFAAKEGTPIYAPADGIVKRVFWNRGGGNTLEIDHAGGILTGYAHAQRYVVAAGQRVKQGQLIGYVGSTGELTTGPHLHFYTEQNGTKIDPLSIFDELADTPASVYQDTVANLLNWFKDSLKEDIGKRTWGEYAGTDDFWNINTDFGALGGAPLSAMRDRVQAAVRELGWENRTIEEADIQQFSEAVAAVEEPVAPWDAAAQAVGGIAEAIGAIVTFLFDPMSWARILALLAGAVLAFVGWRSMWAASSGGVAPV